MPEVPWSGIDYLETVNGPSERYPPLRVLFLAHRVAATGLLTVRSANRERGLFLQLGRIVAASGFVGVLRTLGVEGEPNEDLVGLVGRAVAAGHTPDRAIEVATNGIAAALASWADLRGGTVIFDRSAPEPLARLPLATGIPRLIARGIQQARTPEMLRAAFAPRLRNPVKLSLPDDSPEHRWGLDPVSTRLLREASRGVTLGELLGMGSQHDALIAFDLLRQLGLVYVEGASAGVRVPPPASTRSVEPRPLESRSVEPRSVEPRSMEPRSSSVSRSPNRSSAPSSPPPASPPPASPPPASPPPRPDAELIRSLREAWSAMEGAEPAAILGLTRSADLTEAGIERAYRDMSVRYHPDRHHGASAEVKDLVARCFSRCSEALARLRDPAVRNEAQARLKAQEEGRVYISDADRRSARVLFARGEIAFRSRRYAEALPDLEQAVARDPGNWRYMALQVQASCLAGRIGAVAADAALAPLVQQAPEGVSRADLLYAMGELLLRENNEAQANQRFLAALKEFPEHVGAKRRAWLQKRRAEESDVGKSGLLGGLLSRKR